VAAARAHEAEARAKLERVAGLTAEQARAELIAGLEAEAQREGARLARKIEDEARQAAEREAKHLVLQASQRVNIRDVMESTVSFIELPNDEMKGRIIGKEGRNIRALEMATGIDLIVDDTPRSIWISSFDPLRREIARVSVDRLLVDGRIHPARIEEVVQQVREEIDVLIEEKGQEAAFELGIPELHPKLARLVGRMRYHTNRGQNLLQHSLEVATIVQHMALELGGDASTARRAGLLHEIGHVSEEPTSTHPLIVAAELCEQYREPQAVADAIRALHPDVQPTTLEALLLNTANRLSDARPGARKENLAVFIERLRRLEAVATRFEGVRQAYAVKAGKELRVIVDVERTKDESAYRLSKEIARALEREVSYPGQIKVSVIRETRAVRFAV
jgi:ribonuclease Y